MNRVSTMNIFIDNRQQLKDNFVLFNKIETYVDGCNAEEGIPMYFKTENHSNTWNNYKLMIVQPENQNNTYNLVTIAHFYTHYKYTYGLLELYENRKKYENNFKILIEFQNRPDNKFDMYISVYVDKLHLINIYEQSDIPKLLFKIIQDDSIRPSIEYYENKNPVKIKTSELTELSNSLNSQYKRELFPYQKNNIIKMKNLETRIKNNYGFYETFQLFPSDDDLLTCDVEFLFKIKDIDEYILCDHNGTMMNESNMNISKLYYKGGVLSDEIGLGKTCSMIGLIMESYKEKCSLVLCPTRLCKQWEQEINLTGNLRCKIVSSITQFKKINYENIQNFDVLIVSFNFLTNQNYKNYVEENTESFRLDHYNWERVILDEGHEYLCSGFRRKPINKIRTEIYKLKSNFRWICSGTPFPNNQGFWNTLLYLTSQDTLKNGDLYTNACYLCRQYYHLLPQFCNDLFIKNTKKSVSNQVSIPEYTINTTFLDQTLIERAIYDSALGDTNKMIELCNHILVSENHINILGNKPLPLNEIHKKMTLYYQKKIAKLIKKLENLNQVKNVNELYNSQLENNDELTEKIQFTEQEILKNQSKFNIFNELDEKIEEIDTCPVCYEDFESRTRSITPCGHIICSSCITVIFKNGKSNTEICPMCRFQFNKQSLEFVESEKKLDDPNNKWGTKMSKLIKHVHKILSEDDSNRFIIFSQWDSMLKLVGKVLQESEINHLFLNGSIHVISGRIKKFKLDKSVRVVLLSSEKAASGLNLTEATHIVLLDTLNTDKESSKIIEEQAIGRSVRIGQQKNVHIQRFIMRDTIEHEYYIRNIS